jgi:hypothetical protein
MSASASPDRLSLALPVDVMRRIDATIGGGQIDADQPLGSGDDYDTIAAAIEDAEGEFRSEVALSARVSREGIPGRRETFEQPTYKVSGHKLTKGTYTGVWTDYLPEEQSIMLQYGRVLPFDATQDDAVYFYRGLRGDSDDEWVDITDEQGDIWTIVDNRSGRFAFDPYQLVEYVLDDYAGDYRSFPSFLKRMRFAISYRHGVLDRSSEQVGQTTLSTSLSDAETGAVSVADVDVLSTGAVGRSAILRVGTEYVSATYDRAAGDITILERGVRGTDPVAHDADESVMFVPPEYRKAVASRAAAEVATSARYSAWLPDADDAMTRSELVGRLDDTYSRIVDALA